MDTDTDAYVFAVVKDTINSHTKQGASQATKFVDYHIADGWTLLDEGGESSEFGPKTIKKYVDI
ncbi:MAG: hypothetical protein IJH64_11710, partial [Oscillospiraceae bacterium]|nr:hypothetical protein [Oscillospiraceae bacterium]